uniref:RING-type E3 ubiquitin transferase n=1 Tax=Erpetoichthys calabaricus TaxID=27687 RepID=A0A8C4RS87_ERPCA
MDCSKASDRKMSDETCTPLTLICVGSSFALSGLFYHLYKRKREEIQQLKKIPKVELNEELLRQLHALHHNRLPYVAIEGVVLPDGEPLASQYVPRCYGVIQRVIVQEYKKVLNRITNTWNTAKHNRKETTNTVPFSLVPAGIYSTPVTVHVESPMTATDLYLEMVYSRIRKAKETFMGYFEQEMSGEKPWCLEEREEMLKVGSTLTGFGELIMDSSRVLRLRPPQNGQKYLLITSSYQSYLQQHQSSVNMWKMLTAVFGLAGATVLLVFLYRRYLKESEKKGT